MIHSALLKLITSVHQKHPRMGKRKRRQATNQKVFKTNLATKHLYSEHIGNAYK